MSDFCIVCGDKAGLINRFTVEQGFVCGLRCMEKHRRSSGFFGDQDEESLKAEESETSSNEQANLGTTSFIASVLIFLGWLGLFAAIFLMIYLGDSLSGQGMMSILAVGIVGWAQMVGFGTVINVLYEIKNKL